jgi:hypothetical protein
MLSSAADEGAALLDDDKKVVDEKEDIATGISRTRTRTSAMMIVSRDNPTTTKIAIVGNNTSYSMRSISTTAAASNCCQKSTNTNTTKNEGAATTISASCQPINSSFPCTAGSQDKESNVEIEMLKPRRGQTTIKMGPARGQDDYYYEQPRHFPHDKEYQQRRPPLFSLGSLETIDNGLCHYTPRPNDAFHYYYTGNTQSKWIDTWNNNDEQSYVLGANSKGASSGGGNDKEVDASCSSSLHASGVLLTSSSPHHCYSRSSFSSNQQHGHENQQLEFLSEYYDQQDSSWPKIGEDCDNLYQNRYRIEDDIAAYCPDVGNTTAKAATAHGSANNRIFYPDSTNTNPAVRNKSMNGNRRQDCKHDYEFRLPVQPLVGRTDKMDIKDFTMTRTNCNNLDCYDNEKDMSIDQQFALPDMPPLYNATTFELEQDQSRPSSAMLDDLISQLDSSNNREYDDNLLLFTADHEVINNMGIIKNKCPRGRLLVESSIITDSDHMAPHVNDSHSIPSRPTAMRPFSESISYPPLQQQYVPHCTDISVQNCRNEISSINKRKGGASINERKGGGVTAAVSTQSYALSVKQRRCMDYSPHHRVVQNKAAKQLCSRFNGTRSSWSDGSFGNSDQESIDNKTENKRLSHLSLRPPPRHDRDRQILPLSSKGDKKWLSDFQCFLRSHCMEVFSASAEDVASRMNSKRVALNQVGIRCRFCAHLPYRERANRSSSFPSSTNGLYHCATMMARDHFANCKAMPPSILHQYLQLKAQFNYSEHDSKTYWMKSARVDLGLMDTDHGIRFST